MKKSVILTSPLKMMIPIIKVVGDFCNLRCKYCFYNTKDQSIPHVISDELLETFITQYMELFNGYLFFIWHGGEPLLAGLSFFQKVVDLQMKNIKEGQTIQNSIQTNATFINDEWAKFFKAHNFRVGVSLDGNEISHNRFRVNNKGRGSFDQTMRGIMILRKYGIKPGIIQTITRNNVDRVKEDFVFFANTLSVKKWGVNVFYGVDVASKTILSQSITNEKLIKFLRVCIDLWLNQNDSNLQIREIENFVAGALDKRASNCSFNSSCASYFCLNYDGKIYPCDRFSDSSEFLFGDLSRQSLPEILNGPIRLKYVNVVNSLHPDCVICEWRNACNNGCPHHRIGGVRGKYYYCEARKSAFSYIKEKISRADLIGEYVKKGGVKNGKGDERATRRIGKSNRTFQ